jgi:hypothetical protein
MDKNLDFFCFVTSYDFLSLKNDVNVSSKRNKHENIRIRTVPKCYGSGTLFGNQEDGQCRRWNRIIGRQRDTERLIKGAKEYMGNEGHKNGSNILYIAVLRIHKILVRIPIRIRRSISLTNESGSCDYRNVFLTLFP